MSVRGLRALVFVAATALALPVAAQTGSLEIDVAAAASGDPLPGATVELSSPLGYVARTAVVTDPAGRARFPVLRVGGDYVIDVTMPGFAGQRHAAIRVHAEQTARLQVRLSPSLEERVDVIAQREVVDLEQTGGSTRFGDELLGNLPVLGRLYQNVLSLAPGVNDADQDGNPNVHGARSRDFQAQVSGVSNVDPLTGKWLSYVNYDSIEEIEVLPWGAGVEFGRAQGGYARVLQKQGSNELEGVLSLLYRSSRLDRDGAGNDIGEVTPKFETIQPALHLSGAFVRDRLWFRLSHEWIDREDPIDVLNAVQVVTTRQAIHSDQLTWQVSPRNKLALHYDHDPLTIENFDVSTAVPPESSRTFERGGPTYSLSWVAPYSSRIIVDSRVAYQNHETTVRPTLEGQEQDCMVFARYPRLNTAYCYDTATGLYSGSYPENYEDQRQRLTVRSDATVFVPRFAGASHQIKLGFIVENERYWRELTRGPSMTVDKTFFALGWPPVVGTAQITAPVPDSSLSNATGVSWGLYAEDQLKPAAGLSLQLGLRFDREEIRGAGKQQFDPAAEAAAFFARWYPEMPAVFVNAIAREVFTAYEDIDELRRQLADVLGVNTALVPLNPVAQESSFWFNDRGAEGIEVVNDNVSPRIAVAWDPWADGKTKLSASWGRYYDKIFLAVPLIELDPGRTFFTASATPIPFRSAPLVYPGVLPSLNATVSTRVVERALRTPYQDELGVSFERALWPETSIKLSWLQRKFADQFQDVDINHAPGGVAYNPGWGEILLLGNYNTADYHSWIVELVRRFYRGWEASASYTWSEAIGDGEDFDQLLGNTVDRADTERGFLSYDQRHVARLNVVSLAASGVRLGGTVRWESGLPFSIMESSPVVFVLPRAYATLGIPGRQFNYSFPTGQRNDQRNESFWTFDVSATGDLALGRGVQLQLRGEIFNLLNDDTLTESDTIDGNFAGQRRFGRRYQLGLRLAF